MSVTLKEIEPEYIYVTIPAEYICIYHRILAMLADYGEEMLKDCKASCTDKNSGVIECKNMFDAAVAARKLGKDKLAETLIKYIKVKINQIYKGKDNSTSFVFPVDENGELKAIVSCGERPKFEIDPDDGELYKHKLNTGFVEHFYLGEEDESDNDDVEDSRLSVTLKPRWELIEGEYRPCADINVTYDNEDIINKCTLEYYFDDVQVNKFIDVVNVNKGIHTFTLVTTYKGIVNIQSEDLNYGNS